MAGFGLGCWGGVFLTGVIALECGIPEVWLEIGKSISVFTKEILRVDAWAIDSQP